MEATGTDYIFSLSAGLRSHDNPWIIQEQKNLTAMQNNYVSHNF